MTGENRTDAFATFDMLAVPSTWFETGPYTVLEAFAAAFPFWEATMAASPSASWTEERWRARAPGDANACADALRRVYEQHRAGDWSWALPEPRTSRDIAEETEETILHAIMMNTYGIIIGCLKSGTTSLYRYLIQHPEISGCKEKEPNFFASDENWERGADWYRGLWPPEVGPVLMEATPLYTWVPMLPNAAARIASMEDSVVEDFRFLYVMRDPIRELNLKSYTALLEATSFLKIL